MKKTDACHRMVSHHSLQDSTELMYYSKVSSIQQRASPLKLAATLRGSQPGCNPPCSLWRHWWRHNSETIRDREKRRPPRPMKSSALSNAENRFALRQLLQNRKLRHLWSHNLGWRWKLQKMAWENFSIGALYSINKNQDNPIKTVGRDSFLSPKTRGRTAPIFYGTQLDPDT